MRNEFMFDLNTVQCEPTDSGQPGTVPLCQWESFQFDCAQINIIGVSRVGLRGGIVNMSARACSEKNKPYKWSASQDSDERRWLRQKKSFSVEKGMSALRAGDVLVFPLHLL